VVFGRDENGPVQLVGGAVSASIDAFSTYAIARFADREFPGKVTVERV